MILVKSLIILFLLILFAQFFNPVIDFLARKFYDQREGFTQTEEKKEKEKEKEKYEQLKYTTSSPFKKHDEMDMDAQLMNKLQENMTDLLRLKDEANEINNSMKNYN
jgi:hypothetical protein